MAGSLNKVTLIGNLGADPEVRTMGNGKKVATFSLATTENWTDKSTNERKEATEWHRVVVFNEVLLRVVEDYVKKGSKLYLEGNLQTRKWQDQSGQDRYTTEIVVQNFKGTLILLDSRGDSAQTITNNRPEMVGQSSPEAVQATEAIADEFDDEIPF
tara:strand:+ start:1594 stop:2064 length:471 start_codon:yes stop_codon:yes gene_type:complete